MATLESQYKRFIKENPESTFTYDEWLKWFQEKIQEAFDKLKEDGNKDN